MESALEMQNLSPSLTTPQFHILAHLPVHGRLQCVFHRQRAAIDEKVTLHSGQAHHPMKRANEHGEVFRIDVRIGDLCACRIRQVLLHFSSIELRMIEPDRQRTKETVEVEETPSAGRIPKIGTAAFREIDYDSKTVGQYVLLKFREHDLRRSWGHRLHSTTKYVSAEKCQTTHCQHDAPINTSAFQPLELITQWG